MEIPNKAGCIHRLQPILAEARKRSGDGASMMLTEVKRMLTHFHGKILKVVAFRNFLLNTGIHGFVGNIGFYSRARVGHDAPIGNVSQYAFDKGPRFAHFGFDRVDRANLVPKCAKTVIALGQ
jgi:hypothetical protein